MKWNKKYKSICILIAGLQFLSLYYHSGLKMHIPQKNNQGNNNAALIYP